jgi:hypothetical protein
VRDGSERVCGMSSSNRSVLIYYSSLAGRGGVNETFDLVGFRLEERMTKMMSVILRNNKILIINFFSSTLMPATVTRH